MAKKAKVVKKVPPNLIGEYEIKPVNNGFILMPVNLHTHTYREPKDMFVFTSAKALGDFIAARYVNASNSKD